MRTHLVWENERKFYFVSYLSIPATTQGKRTRGTSRDGRDETERRHCQADGWLDERCQRGLGNSSWEVRPRKYPPPVSSTALYRSNLTWGLINTVQRLQHPLQATTMSFLSRKTFLRPALRSTSLLSPVTLSPARRTLITLQDNIVCPPSTELYISIIHQNPSIR
jgi:hypothetical protein